MKRITIFFVLIAAIAFAQTDNASIRKGNEFYRQGDYSMAEKFYRQGGDNPTAQYNLANALIKQKKYDEAQEILSALAASGNNSPALRSAAYYNSGVAHSQQKELEPSIEAYKAALRLNPNDKEARENLQKALLERKKQSGGGGGGGQNMNQNQADKKLQQLEEKERQLQQQRQGKGQGMSQSKDW